MNPRIVSRCVLMLFVLGAGQVAAQAPPCPTPFTFQPSGLYLNGAQLVSTLVGKYVCAKRANGDTWNEFHRGAGGDATFPIIDYKKGPTDPVDPSKPVGTYKIDTAANTVTYTYTGDPGGPYTYVVRSIFALTPTSPGFAFCNVAGGLGIPAIISASPTQPLCQ